MARNRKNRAVTNTTAVHVIGRNLGVRRSRRIARLSELVDQPLRNGRVIFDPAIRSTSIYQSGSHTPLIKSLVNRKSLRDKYLISRCYAVTKKQRLFNSGSGGYRRRLPLPLKKAAIVLHKMHLRRC